MKVLRVILKLGTIGITIGVVLAVLYLLLIRPLIFRMGATTDEVKMSLPGDGWVASLGTRCTQAITIKAPKEIVWAYVVQMGYRKGGWYNWDFINRLAAKDYFYENNRSAERIIPELQNLAKGDSIYLTPQIPPFHVSEMNNNYVLFTAREKESYDVTWVYFLEEVDVDKTRLIVRWTSDVSSGLLQKTFDLFITEPGGFGIQQAQNLKGIKKRAESDYLKMSSKVVN